MSSHSSFVLCIDRAEYKVSLERFKVYRQIPEAKAEALNLIRIVDESGEDYLYPAEMFVPIEVPEKALDAFREAS